MNKKPYVFAAALLFAASLAGCGGSPDEGDADGTYDNLLYSYVDGSWEETLDAVLENGGRVKVSIDAEIAKPSVKSAFVTEVAELEVSQEYKETVLEQIFGASELYLYDINSIPEEQLVHHIAGLQYEADKLSREIEQEYDKDIKERRQIELDAVTEQLEKYKECLETAPADYIPAYDMQGDDFAGNLEGVMYAVHFQNYLNENPQSHLAGIFNVVTPGEVSYPVRNQSIVIEPVDITDVAPENMKNALGIKPDDWLGTMLNMEETEVNPAAQEIADRFIENLGLNGARLDYNFNSSTGGYTGGSGKLVWTADEFPATIEEGYYFNYSIALDTQNNIKAYEADAVFNQWSAYADTSDPVYSRRSCMTVYVKGDRVIYAEINNPIEVISVNEMAEVLSFDIIKDIIRSELSDNIQNYTAHEISDGMAVRFSEMEFGYVRVRDEKRGDLYSYVPAWKMYGRNSYNMDMGAENILIINAIDGTPIYVKDLI